MSNIRENDRVVIHKPGYESKIGVVDKMYSAGLCIVRLEDNTLIKCLREHLTLCEDEDVKSDPDRETITITRGELLRIMTEIVSLVSREAKDTMFELAIAITGTVITKRLDEKLFGRKGDR